MRYFPSILFVLLVGGAVGSRVEAQNLIGAEVPAGRFPVDLSTEHSIGSRYRLVEVNGNVTRQSHFEIDLFNNVKFSVTRERVEIHQGIQTWVGAIDGYAGSSVIIAAHPSGVVSARIDAEGESYSINYKSVGVHAIVEIDPTRLPAEGPGDGLVDVPGSNEGGGIQKDTGQRSGKQGGVLTNPSVCLPGSTCADQVLSVLVVYTDSAESDMGGEAAVLADIAVGISQLNTVAANTGLGHTFELGLARKVSYVESGSAQTDLNSLRFADGLMDEIHVWRDSVGADLVHVILGYGGCGIGNLTADPTEFTSVRAYSASDDWCFRFNKTFPHELGHNMGLRHDRYVDSSETPCSWAHGYVNQEAFGGAQNSRWRTVMAYNNQCSDSGFSCSRIAYYSNPENLYLGDSMGVDIGDPLAADASHLLDRSMCFVSQYRDEPPDTVIVATFQDGYAGYSGSRDTYIYSAAPNNSYGSELQILVDGSPDYAGLLYWNLDSIPDGSIVVGGFISVSITNPTHDTYHLFELKKDWNEISTTWNESSSGINWQSAGANGADDRGSTPLGDVRSIYNGVLSIPLNSDGVAVLQSWIDGASPNHGVLLENYNSSSGDRLNFDSRESPESGRHPRLMVWYAPASAIPTIALAARVILEGAWNGLSMNTDLTSDLPAEHPFGGDPWLYAGHDSVSSDDVTGEAGVPDFFETNTTIVDWVLVQLRSGVPPASQTVIAERAGFLHADGTITDLDGVSNLQFGELGGLEYYVVIDHRNHAAVMSDSLVDFSSGIGAHDFTAGLGTAFGSADPLKLLEPGTAAMFAGDITVDKQITTSDFNLWLVANKSIQTGYVSADLNLDGQCTTSDFNLWLANTKAVAESQVPD